MTDKTKSALGDVVRGLHGEEVELKDQRPAEGAADDSAPTSDWSLATGLMDMDNQRRFVGFSLIVVGVLASGVVGCAGLAHLAFDVRLYMPEVMSAPGYPYLVGAKAFLGASLVGVAFGLIRTGQMMMMPAVFVRDMRLGRDQDDESTLADRVKAIVEVMKS